LNFKFSRAHSSASFFPSLARARCSSVAATYYRARCRPLHCICCRRHCTRARMSAQVLGTAQGLSRHLSACTPRRRNRPPHADPLPCTRSRQAIEWVASPSRSYFTRYRMVPFFSPRASAHSSFLCRRAHLAVAPPHQSSHQGAQWKCANSAVLPHPTSSLESQ
jgi:hypothetical protein